MASTATPKTNKVQNVSSIGDELDCLLLFGLLLPRLDHTPETVYAPNMVRASSPKMVRLQNGFWIMPVPVRQKRRFNTDVGPVEGHALPLFWKSNRNNHGHGRPLGWLYGILNVKKLAGCEVLIGIVFEKAPDPSRVPVRLVVQLIGADRLVAASQA